MLTTNQKGAIAESAVAHAALKLGVGVYAPLGDERCDFIFDLRPRLMRVQCKWACRYDDVVLVRLYSARRARTGLRRSFYSPEEIDAFAAYCLANDQCYLFALDRLGSRNEMRLRLGPTRNNQAKGVKWARDYEFAATLTRLLGP
jgi:PD-(D/E)XK nuclease superfamily protein